MTIALEDRGGKTLLTLVQTGFAAEASRDGHAGGWVETFDRRAGHLTAG